MSDAFQIDIAAERQKLGSAVALRSEVPEWILP
jgi:hypothetical protein